MPSAPATPADDRSDAIVAVAGLSKTYASGFKALDRVDLTIRRGEIFALLGPNGAGKTTLINIICGIVNASEGSVTADGHDIVRDFRAARAKIGLVPQELSTDAFETVWATVSFSRGLFGKAADPAHIEKVLRELSLWDKKGNKILTLSGGMKRRVLIAKALSHEPRILFLDEPTAGVDVELRRDMWQMVRRLRDSGVTIILTTHYIEEAEQMADRIGVISKGRIILVEDKDVLMRKLGKKQLTLSAAEPARGHSGGARRLSARALGRRLRAHLHLRRPGRADRHRAAAARARRARHRLQGPALERELARGHLRQPGEPAAMNVHAIRAIYRFEMARTFRTLMQSIASPVLTTSLYFVVFGSAIGSRIGAIDGVSYGAFIIPGLIMLSLLNESISNASFGIYMPKWSGTIYELLSAPVSYVEVVTGYVGAAATKSVLLGLLILATARLFVPYEIVHPAWMVCLPRPHGGHVQPVRLHHRPVGRRLPEAADRPADGRHAAHLPRRRVLLDQDAAAGMADDHAVQSGRLPDQRLPLELLRPGRRQRRGQRGHDDGVPGRVPGRRRLGVQDRLQAEGVSEPPRGASA